MSVTPVRLTAYNIQPDKRTHRTYYISWGGIEGSCPKAGAALELERIKAQGRVIL